MGDRDKSREQLSAELAAARRRIAQLESAGAERARSESDTRRRIEEITLLNRVTTMIASANDLEGALQHVCVELADYLQVPQAGCAILDASQQSARVIADVHPPGAASALDVTIPVQENPSMAYILEHKTALAIADAQADPRVAPLHDVMRQRKVQSILLAPILAGDKVIGTLGFDSFVRREFQEADVVLVQTIVGQVGQLLQRRQAEQTLSESNVQLTLWHKQQSVLGQLTTVFNAATSVEQVTDSIVASVQDLGYTYCSVWEKREDRLRWTTPSLALPDWLMTGIRAAAAALGAGDSTPVYSPLQAENCYARCYREQRAQSVSGSLDLLKELHIGATPFEELPGPIQRTAVKLVERLGISEQTVFPITHYGVIFLASPGVTHAAEHRDWIQIVLKQASTAIERLRAVEALHALNTTLEAQVAERTAEIAAEKEKSDAILRSVGDAITVTDLQMNIQYVNEAFTELTGYPAEEALGQSVGFMSRRASPDRVSQFMDTVIESDQLWRQEVVARRKDGRLYDAVLTIAPIHDTDDKLVGFVASHRDISQERELERARNRFMTHVSHQLRTPVTNLKLYAQMLRKGVPQDKAGHHLRILEEQSLRLSDLVQDILEITAVDAGQAVRTWERVSLFSLIKSVVGSHQERARTAGLTVQITSLPPNLPAVYGDPIRIGQALGEVLENAIIFTPAGGQVTVFVATSIQEGRTWVTIAISDTGPGIPEDEREQVFERFFRGKIAESGHLTGSGLGLSLAYEIVRAHGGHMTVESELDLGSTFTIWLLGADPGN